MKVSRLPHAQRVARQLVQPPRESPCVVTVFQALAWAAIVAAIAITMRWQWGGARWSLARLTLAALAVAVLMPLWRWTAGRLDSAELAGQLVLSVRLVVLLLLGAWILPARRRLLLGAAVAVVVVACFGLQRYWLVWIARDPILRARLGLDLWIVLAITLLIGFCRRVLKETEPIRARELVLPVLWLSCLTALIELGLRTALYRVIPPFAMISIDPLSLFREHRSWLVPAIQLVNYGVPALLVALLTRVLPGGVPRRAAWLLVIFPAVLRLLLFVPFIHPLALGTLAFGLAVFFTNRILGRPDRFARRARMGFPLAAAVILVLVARAQWQAQSERTQQLAALPEPRAGQPNVIVITLDTVRVQSLSLNGAPRATTPELKRWAARGVMFTQAMVPSSWTLPTHASLFTGLLPSVHGADFLTPLSAAEPTLAETLAASGYETAGFVANSAMCGSHTGLGRGFVRYSDLYSPLTAIFRDSPLRFLPTGWMPHERRSALEINQELFGWLDDRTTRPFFAFLNYFDAHDPYFVPDPSFDTFTTLDPRQREALRRAWLMGEMDQTDPVQAQLALDTYEAAIAYLDHQLSQLLEELESRGRLDDTYIFIMNDHGEHFGEHGLVGHATSLFWQLIGSPLVVLGPGLPEGRVVNEPVSLIDLAATLQDLAGQGPARLMPGSSMTPQWAASRPVDDEASPALLFAELCQAVNQPDHLNAAGPIRALRAGRWHYIRYYGLGREELYDLDADPLEMVDLAQDPGLQDTLAQMRAWFGTVFPDSTSAESEPAALSPNEHR